MARADGGSMAPALVRHPQIDDAVHSSLPELVRLATGAPDSEGLAWQAHCCSWPPPPEARPGSHLTALPRGESRHGDRSSSRHKGIVWLCPTTVMLLGAQRTRALRACPERQGASLPLADSPESGAQEASRCRCR